MTINCVKNEDNTVTLNTTVEGDAWKKAQQKAFAKHKAALNLKGFRKGHVPDSVAQKFIPQDVVYYEAANLLAQDLLEEGIKEFSLELIDRPTFDYKDASADSVVLEFTCTVAPKPVLGEYKNLGIAKDAVEVADEEVDSALEDLRKKQADLVLVEDETPAANGDTVKIDFAGTLDGVPFDGGSAEDVNVVLGSNTFIPGFEEQIEGMKTGDVKDINVTFPEEYPAPNLAGKPAVFNIKVKEISKTELPELNDEFVAGLGREDAKTVEELKAALRKEMEASKEAQAQDAFVNAVIKAAVDNASVEIPAVMVDAETDAMYKNFVQRLMQSGFEESQYLSATGQSPETIKESMRSEAENSVKTRLVLNAIAAAEGLEVAQEDVDKELNLISEMYNIPAEQLIKLINTDELKGDLLRQKAVTLLESAQ